MKTFSISENDIQLLKAIRPFMSGKSQKLLDLLLVTINVFKPEEPNQKINYDALNTLLTMVQESIEAKKNMKTLLSWRSTKNTKKSQTIKQKMLRIC